ncbi:MAG TPA: hypothetical protein DCM01_16270 [Dielma fastidiosa]|nr:hypothetical protein [Dielma fastidiosa]
MIKHMIKLHDTIFFSIISSLAQSVSFYIKHSAFNKIIFHLELICQFNTKKRSNHDLYLMNNYGISQKERFD